MIDQLTLADLLRVAAWGFFGSAPMFFAYAMGTLAEKPEEDVAKAFMLWLCLGCQIAFGVAAYMAGGR